MINTITKKQYPDVFADLMEFVVHESYHQHRRGSNYYTSKILKFDGKVLPEHPELHGLWQTDTFIWDHEYGGDLPDKAHRVERKTRMVEEVYYEQVANTEVEKWKAKYYIAPG
jgi:hypothetical protein